MGFLVQPWFLILFAAVSFFVFGTVGARYKHKGEVANLRFTRWAMVILCVAIATLGVLKGLQDRKLNPLPPQTEIAPVAVR
jgi:hypothetical protein